jgi:SAM-dependent methyltransferase
VAELSAATRPDRTAPQPEATARGGSACPACGSDDGRVRFSVSAREAAYHFVVAEAEPERFAALVRDLDARWGGHRCRVIECGNCQFCYADPFVAGDSTFYRLAYPHHGYPRDRWEFRVTAAEVRQIADLSPRRERRLLEIGSGEGAFIRQVCPSVILPANVLCTEYSRNGKAAVEALGIECLACDVRELRDARYRQRFDFICLFQVLEHMDRIDELFRHLAWLSQPDASVFISVPNDRLIEFYEQNGCLLDMPPNHVSRWNAKAFTLLAQRHGWRVAAHAYGPQAFLPLYQRVAIYRYMRQSQCSGTLSNRIAAIADARVRRFAQIAAIAGHAVRAMPLIPRLRSPDLGDSQWVRLVKG